MDLSDECCYLERMSQCMMLPAVTCADDRVAAIACVVHPFVRDRIRLLRMPGLDTGVSILGPLKRLVEEVYSTQDVHLDKCCFLRKYTGLVESARAMVGDARREYVMIL